MGNDVHQLAIAYTCGGEFMESILHFQASVAASATPEADSNALIVAFAASMQGPLLGMMSPDCSLLALKAKRVNNTGGPSTLQIEPAGTVGTFTGANMNTRDAALLTFDYYNASATKPTWRVGKQFVGGVPKTAETDNAWTSPYITASQAYAAALIADASSSPGPWVSGIWSGKYGVFYTGTGWELVPEIGSLRRRIRPYP